MGVYIYQKSLNHAHSKGGHLLRLGTQGPNGNPVAVLPPPPPPRTYLASHQVLPSDSEVSPGSSFRSLFPEPRRIRGVRRTTGFPAQRQGHGRRLPPRCQQAFQTQTHSCPHPDPTAYRPPTPTPSLRVKTKFHVPLAVLPHPLLRPAPGWTVCSSPKAPRPSQLRACTHPAPLAAAFSPRPRQQHPSPFKAELKHSGPQETFCSLRSGAERQHLPPCTAAAMPVCLSLT